MTDKKLRSGIHLDTKQISKDVSKELEIDFDEAAVELELEIDFDEAAVELVGEMVFKKLLLYGSDLEAFCKHARRSTVTPDDDVKLLCRNNASLKVFSNMNAQQQGMK
ncbi:CENP-S protein [Popillia japonica]|uniref:Centromere protein S n=1 Tax=Popillia japonica TaxID=7064 RepID=A0AAW1JAP3_POPJA